MHSLRIVGVFLLTFSILAFTASSPRVISVTENLAEPSPYSTFEIHLQGFAENPATANIGYIRLVIDVDGSMPWALTSQGIAGACAGWWESTGSGSINGPSVFMSAHDPYAVTSRAYVEYPLQDGMLFWINCTAPVTGLSQIYFWNAPQIGDFGANQYPDLVELVELTASRAVFATEKVSLRGTTWGRVKALF